MSTATATGDAGAGTAAQERAGGVDNQQDRPRRVLDIYEPLRGGPCGIVGLMKMFIADVYRSLLLEWFGSLSRKLKHRHRCSTCWIRSWKGMWVQEREGGQVGW